jgi:Flp pilus assembly pilin Flp
MGDVRPSAPVLGDVMSRLERRVRDFWTDDTGQDLIEYGLLASIIAIAGVAVFPQIQAVMDDVFVGWETPVYDIWQPNDPITP